MSFGVEHDTGSKSWRQTSLWLLTGAVDLHHLAEVVWPHCCKTICVPLWVCAQEKSTRGIHTKLPAAAVSAFWISVLEFLQVLSQDSLCSRLDLLYLSVGRDWIMQTAFSLWWIWQPARLNLEANAWNFKWGQANKYGDLSSIPGMFSKPIKSTECDYYSS